MHGAGSTREEDGGIVCVRLPARGVSEPRQREHDPPLPLDRRNLSGQAGCARDAENLAAVRSCRRLKATTER